MLAVGRTESIVYIYVGIGGELLGKVFLAVLHLRLGSIVFWRAFFNTDRLAFLFWIVAEILEQKCLSALQCCGLCIGVACVLGELDLNAESIAYVLDNLAQ